MTRPSRLVMALTFVIGTMASPLRGQTDSEPSRVATSFDFTQVIQQPAGPPPTPRHTGIKALLKGLVSDVTHLPSRENLLWAGVGGGLALAVHPFDDDVNRKLVGSTTADHVFKAGEVLGEL